MPPRTAGFGNRDRFELNGKIGLLRAAGLIVLRECRQGQHNVCTQWQHSIATSPILCKFNLWRILVAETPFLGNLATARCAGQVSESATTWQIFRKIEYAAGMPQDILSAARSKPSNRTRRRCNGFLLNVLCASHLSSVAAWRMEERTDLSSAR
jgi:hypothetical protein